jgi:hypothetical protein
LMRRNVPEAFMDPPPPVPVNPPSPRAAKLANGLPDNLFIC